ncbi:type II secretion system protein E [Natrinema pellirubrum DSM 15624]|uniref:ATPase, type IV secretory pathway VirB11 component like protein n=1 Tax=Natrinema pellirubrum (strain DSM 15624 / CIP 106293 / JCM 10476 / NCIMB 786 / 157) TaxID=797303 RepID=L0JQ58_NATP1|nr:type II/IV secretion system ATPase subunit [Natrinema pellirubrum]AGB32752.1 ATPase, type IV secretory pathway VirB11 component like protein [Natrinema pellirubrum DSM 15624]ELY75755.1 type II secretion system protein E [Natrinema pellirubrum DSM 15624]
MPDGNHSTGDGNPSRVPSNPPSDIGPASSLEDDGDAGTDDALETGTGPDPTSAIAPDDSRSADAIRDAVLDDVRASFDDRPADAFPGRPSDAFIDEEFFDFGYLEAYEEVERYWVNRPYAYVTILYDEATNTNRYHVVEPDLDEFEEYVREDLIRSLRSDLLYKEFDGEVDRAATFDEEVPRVMREHAATVGDGSLHQLLYYLRRDFVSYGKIDPIMRDRGVEDVSCDGADRPVFVYHHGYRDLRTNLSFSDERLSAYVVRLAQRAGKHLSVADPLVDASLPDGSRVQLTLGGEVTTGGPNFTVRKFAEVPFTPVDLVNWGTFSLEEMAYLWLAVENNASVLFAGGTGSGKTTSLNAVSMFVPPESKVVSIEDTPELTLPHDNWIQSVTREGVTAGGRGSVSMFDLLQAALRQRPEYLVIGEIRTETDVALTFFQSIATGHTAYTTFHADSVRGLLSRLQNEPLNVPTGMIGNLDIVSIQRQTTQEGKRVRRNRRLVEFGHHEDEGDGVDPHEVFRYEPASDGFERSADSRVLERIADERGWPHGRIERELERRAAVLEYLLDEGITDYERVARVIQGFIRDPTYVLEEVRAGDLDPETIAVTEADD